MLKPMATEPILPNFETRDDFLDWCAKHHQGWIVADAKPLVLGLGFIAIKKTRGDYYAFSGQLIEAWIYSHKFEVGRTYYIAEGWYRLLYDDRRTDTLYFTDVNFYSRLVLYHLRIRQWIRDFKLRGKVTLYIWGVIKKRDW